MPNAAIKSTVYCLNHTPELGFHYGTTPYLERHDKPDSPFLASLPKLIQPYADAARYAPNLAYIGAMTIEQLEAQPSPVARQPLGRSHSLWQVWRNHARG